MIESSVQFKHTFFALAPKNSFTGNSFEGTVPTNPLRGGNQSFVGGKVNIGSIEAQRLVAPNLGMANSTTNTHYGNIGLLLQRHIRSVQQKYTGQSLSVLCRISSSAKRDSFK